MAGKVRFYSGTSAEYASATKSADSLYFLTDTLQLYRGENLYSKNFRVVTSTSDEENPVPGILYIETNTGMLYIYENSAWVQLTKSFDTTVSENGVNPVTSGAVYTAIQAVITAQDTINKADTEAQTDLDQRLSDVEATLGTGGSGENSFGARLTAAETDITALETAVGDATSGLVKDVTDLKNQKLDLTGGTLTGALTLAGAPTEDSQAATKKYVDDSVSTEVAAVIGGAPEAYDTLKEIADWITTDGSGVADLTTEVAKKVDKVEGMGLSTNDYTNEEKNKLAAIDAEAEVNVLETVKINGEALAVDATKAVNILIADGTTNGTITVNGKTVNVYGLKSAAFQESTAFATAAQGELAAAALQAGDITSGTIQGTIRVKGTNIQVYGLGSMAYANTTDYIAASRLGEIGSGTISKYVDDKTSAALTSANSYTDSVVNSAIDTALTWNAI